MTMYQLKWMGIYILFVLAFCLVSYVIAILTEEK